MNSSLEERTQVYRIPVKPKYKRRKKQKRSNNNFPQKVLLFFVMVFAVFYAICHFLDASFFADSASKHSPVEFTFNFSPKRQNILLMGVDVAQNQDNPFKGNRTDTMLLISIAPYGKNVNIISIPRDSKVYIAGKSKADKINHAFAFGGARLAVRTVEETFGVKINNYLAISNQGLIKMIDTLGGLPIYIEKDMKYDDNTAKLHINLKKGNNLLDGRQTEGFLRFRHDSYGDIGRIRRQQWFFNALLARIKDPTVIVKMPELLKIIPEYIETDMSGYDLAKYVGMAKNVDTSTIQIATVPGQPSTKGVISYWILDPEKTQELINNLVYRNKRDVDPSEVSVGILYTNSQEETAQQLKSELEERGMNVKMQKSDSISKNYIAIHNLDLAGEMVNSLKRDLPEIKEKHTIYDPVGINRTGRDMTIVLSNL